MSCSLDLARGPSLDELLQGCIDAFDEQGRVRDPQLVRLFLTMHPWYLPPAQLAAKLLAAIEASEGSPQGPILHLKIKHLVRYWVRAFPGELGGDPQFRGRLRQLQEALGGQPLGEPPRGDPGRDPEAAPEPPPEGAESLDPAGPPPAPPPRHKRWQLLELLGEEELAAQLTHLEGRGLARVGAAELRRFARQGAPAGCAALQAAVALSNSVSRWVQLLVLSPAAAPGRAQALGRCLRLAQKLLELRNFHSLMAVVGGLGHGSVLRLHQTLALLPPGDAQLWARLAEAVGSGGNYRRYRALLGGAGGAGGFRLPALGVHLRDLVALEEALPDWGGPGRPHPEKLRRRFEILATLGGGGGEPPVPAHPALLQLLAVSLSLGHSEEELYQLSLQREPRGRGQGGPPPALPPVSPLEEWVLPDPPRPDPQLLRQQLERLVESIFCHFDVDGDGRISRAELGVLRRSFPQLRGLRDPPAEDGGGLTRGQLLSCLLRCSEWGRGAGGGAPPQGPPHSFQPTRGPAACQHCGGVILGLQKTGLRCRGCGLRCHPQCRERLRADCRRRTQSVADPGTPPPGPSPGTPPPGPSPGTPPPGPSPRPRSFSFSLPWNRRGSQSPPEPPREPQPLEEEVFDTHL